MVNEIFNYCVYILEVIGEVTGWGYQLSNLIIWYTTSPDTFILWYVVKN
jgi:hypothetical protein